MTNNANIKGFGTGFVYGSEIGGEYLNTLNKLHETLSSIRTNPLAVRSRVPSASPASNMFNNFAALPTPSPFMRPSERGILPSAQKAATSTVPVEKSAANFVVGRNIGLNAKEPAGTSQDLEQIEHAVNQEDQRRHVHLHAGLDAPEGDPGRVQDPDGLPEGGQQAEQAHDLLRRRLVSANKEWTSMDVVTLGVFIESPVDRGDQQQRRPDVFAEAPPKL
ncbi:uncharacterized protein J3D65DRAFT_666689 [Phyllosticta citribraziliensis]|uniref:Uncharacterized protein n=1 Tax=Phyllosticta citribraziliensis TaxID=989973 RepID=A0ABR1LY02_9PEZI